MQHQLTHRLTDHPGADQPLAYLPPPHRAARKRLANHRDGTRARCVVEAEVLAATRTELVDSGAEDIQQPAHVISRAEMQGPAHQPGSNNRTVHLEGAIHRAGGDPHAADAHLMPRCIKRLRLKSADRTSHRGDVSIKPGVIGEVL